MTPYFLPQPNAEQVLDPVHGSLVSPLIDSERALGFLLGLLSSLETKSTPPSSDEQEHRHWLHSDFFAGGLQVKPRIWHVNLRGFV